MSGRRVTGPRWGGALVVLALASAACSGRADEPVGASTPAPGTGPRIVSSVGLAPVMPRVVAGTHASARVAVPALQRLSNRIDESLTAPARVTPATRVTQKQAAGDQVLVRWSVGRALPDAAARLRVRTDARTILRLVQTSGLRYGSVLLLATGGALRGGKRTVSVVVRVKYSPGLVRRTRWAAVRPDRLFGMADDKPAVVAPGYR